MSHALRRFRECRGDGPPPLAAVREFARTHAAPTAGEVAALAREVKLPPATVRGALSYYADLHSGARRLAVCLGTSCHLAGTTPALAKGEDRRPVYCLGYCDRSPAVLRGADEVLLESTAAALLRAAGGGPPEVVPPAPRPEQPPIRCLAPRAVVTRRIARGDFSGLARARADGAYSALAAALSGPPADVLEAIGRSGQRGRGGAGFRTGDKWRACAQAPGPVRYVVANGDEGDPGSFIDRVLMECDPHAILEGLLLCAFAVGARHAVVFVRGEYPAALARMSAAVDDARRDGLIGPSVLGSRFSCEVEVFSGMGSYVCGEDTALLNAIEGFRGEVRIKPPYPATRGLHGRPTVVNNVETLANVPSILELGPERYAAMGTADCPGTKALCLNHGFARPGIVEVEFGTNLRAVVEGSEAGGGGSGGRRIEAVLLGGPMGSVLTPAEWDVPLCYGSLARRDLALGHGGLVALLEGADLRALLEHWAGFMADESCGKCVPCGLGSRRARQIVQAGLPAGAARELDSLFDLMESASLCAFGQLMPAPMRQLLAHFGDRIRGATP